MSKKIIVKTPYAGYELVDFGSGRVLERYGQVLVDRTSLDRGGDRVMSDWSSDWRYTTQAAMNTWRPANQQASPEWTLDYFSTQLPLRLLDNGRPSLIPEHFACVQWLDERLRGCYHLDEIRVLNLFGGSGITSAAAIQAGASVVHVEPLREAMDIARQFLGAWDVEFVHDDPHAYVDQAIREQQKFDLIVIQPPALHKSEHKRSWDIKCDLGPMMMKIPRLLKSPFRGVWLSPQLQTWQADSLLPLLKETLPGRCIEDVQICLATRDNRYLRAGIAVYAYDEDELPDADGLRPVLSAENLETRLDVYLDPVLSSRRTASAPARALARYTREQQEFVLHWVEVLARTNAEIAYQFSTYVSRALDLMSIEDVKTWLLSATDAFDVTGLHAGIAILKSVEGYAEQIQARQKGIVLDEINNVLTLFVQGLNGRALKIDQADRCYTDTETLYLPQQINLFADKQKNFQLYKAMLVHQWSLTWCGSFHVDVRDVLQGFADSEKALKVFHRLEIIRTSTHLQRYLPGIYRLMQELCELNNESLVPSAWGQDIAPLLEIDASIHDSLTLLPLCYELPMPSTLCFQGELRLDEVDRVRSLRLQKDKQALQAMLWKLEDEAQEMLENLAGLDEGGDKKQLQIEVDIDEELGDVVVEMTLDGTPLPPPDEVLNVISSIYQDLGEIPPEYMVAAGDGAYRMDDTEDEDKSRDVWKGNYHEEGAFLYDEWDCKRQSYRKNWCVLREVDVRKQSIDFIDHTLSKHKGLVHEIRRTFEILRGEDKLLKKQPYGDDVDIDAVVEAMGDVSSGLEMSEHLFTKKHKLDRNIAVMFMVDMSGSTKGWINDAERESLILLCEALEILGDRYAIYGFSGMTRKRCELYKIKHFDDPYDDEIKGRISGISPQDYTRMGVTIRHLSGLLNQVEAKTKLLITLSDGKPDDFDGYRSEYGIEDTRRALIEAKRDGIHPFCITIDTEGADYLPHMYGAVNYMVLDDVRKLPLRVSDIYRKLTT